MLVTKEFCAGLFPLEEFHSVYRSFAVDVCLCLIIPVGSKEAVSFSCSENDCVIGVSNIHYKTVFSFVGLIEVCSPFSQNFPCFWDIIVRNISSVVKKKLPF